MSYTTLSNFGPSIKSQNNPLVYCSTTGLLSSFNETLGGRNLSGPDSQQCQRFLANYCGTKWDDVCEYLSNDTKSGGYMNVVQTCDPSYCTATIGPLTKGQIIIRNAAAERFLKAMSGNCVRTYQPFDPTSADSYLISVWRPSSDECGSTASCNSYGKCIPIYAVNPETIDNDVVMNKILKQPWIAMDILTNIYNNAIRYGDYENLKGTKLYNFFTSDEFQLTLKTKAKQKTTFISSSCTSCG